MRQLLIINPNTSQSVSKLLQTHAQQAAGPDVLVRTVTARFGAPYIACEASYAVATHATLDAWAAALADDAPTPDAVLIGCFGDPGLLALRQLSQLPVTGLAEASFIAAAAQGRFAIVTGGERWKPMLERLAHSLGFGEQLAGIYTVTATGAELAADPLARFIGNNPTIVMLALGFLLMIGATLLAEGMGVHVPKGYIYAAMAFSALIEGLNMMARRRKR